MNPRRALVAANWKMNGSRAANDSWLREFAAHKRALVCDVVIAAPYVYLEQLRQALGCDEIAAQDVSARELGAFTGDVAVEMLSDTGCGWVIVGHSERRQWHGETDADVAAKAERALRAGLRPIVCIGETLQQREAHQTNAVLSSQLAAVLDRVGAQGLSSGALAYEPVWAIGTGRTASPQQAQEVHAALREQIGSGAAGVRILYGGSVKPANAAELLAQLDIDGGLVGGASLIAGDFLAICNAVPK
ncbi:MAG TPA: triose-phosphate isomerase [Burkholderiaceae bacterium]|nr:triose-phosphate isomerase [Burkholderiaceae bacterium]